MRQGDLVELLEPTMGLKMPTGIRGIVIERIYSHKDKDRNRWAILVNGNIKNVQQNLIREIL
tara:strand:- start:344 stop:529 length:186 start_codon:yes stop_codon:yes gene_type:complete